MGCGASQNKVHIVGEAPTTKPELANPKNRVNSKTGARKGNKKAMGSQDSLGGISNASDRIGSGTSKISRRTMDSGFDDNDNVITEHSDPLMVKEVEEGFSTPRSLDLGITGRPVQQRYSAKDRERMEEKNVMQKLQEEGLIQRPMSRANFGVSFEVVADNPTDMFGAPKRPPPRLAKLEKRKKKKKPMTAEEIERKLALAEERRKEREQQRIERIQAVTNKSDVQNALDTFAQSQLAKDEEEQTKQDIAAENRERRLREMRDKLRAKQERIEKARKKKLATSLDDSVEQLPPLEESPFASKPKIAAGDY